MIIQETLLTMWEYGEWDGVTRACLQLKTGSSVRDPTTAIYGKDRKETAHTSQEEAQNLKRREILANICVEESAELFSKRLCQDYALLDEIDKNQRSEQVPANDKPSAEEGEEAEEGSLPSSSIAEQGEDARDAPQLVQPASLRSSVGASPFVETYRSAVQIHLDAISTRADFPSDCVTQSPLPHTYIHHQLGIDVVIAGKLSVMLAKTLPKSHRLHAPDRPMHVYEQVRKELKRFLKKYSHDSLQSLRTAAWQKNLLQLTDEDYEKLLQQPISTYVLQPEAEPVQVATAEEMAPLHEYLRSAKTLPTAIAGVDPNMSFTKGTICDDKRLDLCKQVIGPGKLNSSSHI